MSNQTGFRQGRLGIGKNPIFPLDISGSTRIEGDLILGGTIADINGTPIEFGASSATLNVGTNMPIPEMTVSQVPSWEDSVTIEGAGKFVDAASAGDIYYNGGNIGIGTTSPKEKLDINGGKLCFTDGQFDGDTTGISFYYGSQSTERKVMFFDGSLVLRSPWDNSAPDNSMRGIYFQQYDGTNIMFLRGDNGNVGIGTTSPSCKLDVTDSGSEGKIQINNDTLALLQLRQPTSDKVVNLEIGRTSGEFSIRNNGGEKIRMKENGNVGIGTTSPGEKLEVNGNIKLGNSNGTLITDNQIYRPGNNDFHIQYGGSGDLTMCYGGGNVGIGTTTPYAKLIVQGTSEPTTGSGYTNTPANMAWPIVVNNVSAAFGNPSNAGYGCGIKFKQYFDNTNDQRWSGIAGVSQGQYSDYTGLAFYTCNNYVTAEKMRILHNGNVGIGTASPSGKLHISGNQHNTYSYGGLLRLHDDSGSASGIWGMINFPDSNTSSTEATGNFYMIGRGAQYSDKCLTIHVPTAGSIDMCSSGSIRMMKIQGNGDIGIGKDVPGYKLHIANESIVNDIQDLLCLETHCNSGGRDGPAILFRERWNNGSYWNLARIAGIEDSGYGGQLAFYTNEGTGSADNTLLERMRIDELGNVGIGIADPATILHLYDTSPILTIETTQGDVNGRYGYIEWKDSGGAYAWVGDGSGSNKAFYIYTYGDPINLETNGGNVGIGTATPYMPFDCVISKYISDADIDQYWDRGIDDGSFFRTENDSFGSGYNYNSNQGRSGDLNDETDGSRPVNLKPISAHFYDNVYISNGGLLVSSDERIKQNIMEISDDISLKILRDISCCSYYYIDDIGRQKTPTLGFIAQQVNKIFPEAVTLTERIIPNVMKRINNFNWVSENSNNTHKLISDLQDVSGVLYRFYVSNNVDEREKRVEHIGNSDNTFTFENKWEHVFCYGYEVPDFHALDKQKLYALNFSATQELDKQQKLDKADIAELKTKNTELENKVTTLEFELAAIKQHLGI